MTEDEKEFLKIQEKNDHYILYVVVGALYFSFFAYEKICTRHLKLFFALSLLCFVFTVMLFLVSRDCSKKAFEEQARRKKDSKKADFYNKHIFKLDDLALFMILAGCSLSAIFFIVNILLV